MKIVTVVGARPQFVKAAVVSRAVGAIEGVRECLVHTGQHYDPAMTDIFFEQMQIPLPDYSLGVGSAPHGAQTGRMLEQVEEVILDERPDWVLVYGDTNSTLAGALAAAKCHIPVAHVEAGLRSYNRRMPEEINRVMTDHVSDRLFAPTEISVANLRGEGIDEAQIERVGDVMYDAALFYAQRNAASNLVPRDEPFALATVHRAENTDDPARFEAILAALCELSNSMSVLLPLHPRTRQRLDDSGGVARFADRITFLDPVGYLEMLSLEQAAQIILTDSGGVQKEAYFFGKPCVTLRGETEWVELVELGRNWLAPPSDAQAIGEVIQTALAAGQRDMDAAAQDGFYGDGTAGEKIARSLAQQ